MLHEIVGCWMHRTMTMLKQQMQRFSKYQNGTAAERKRQGEWEKDVRKNHD